MKTRLKNSPLLIVAVGLILAGRVTAQTFTTLLRVGSNAEESTIGLILSGNTLYGTASGGGSSGRGMVFKVNTDGTGFTNLYNFTAISAGTNSDGEIPSAGLVLLGNTLYGTAAGGGSWNGGTVFAVNTDGTGFTNLHNFGISESSPSGGLILSSNSKVLYGATAYIPASGNGTLFAVNTDGTGFTNLHSFAPLSAPNTGTNSDGAGPNGLILSGNTLYGTTWSGGSSANGTVFKVSTDGIGFTTLHSFTATSASLPYTNDDGAGPNGLVLTGNTLYGTTVGGGSSGSGTVFAVNTNGTGFTNLYSFSATSTNSSGTYTNSDGAIPTGLLLSGNTLYGTTQQGGSSGDGTVFAINTNDTGLATVYNFRSRGGTGPVASLILGNTLYGTEGGQAGYGGNFPATVFSVSFDPQLTPLGSGDKFVLTWPTNYAGFDYTGFTLQSTTNLVSPVWTTNSPAPVVVNGQNTWTNAISGTQQFFRLSK